MTATLVAFVPDLMDRSKIGAAAEALGLTARFVSSATGAARALEELVGSGATGAETPEPGRHAGRDAEMRAPRGPGRADDAVVVAVVVVLDLARAGALDVVGPAAAAGATVLAFGSHVDTEVLAEARAAGCDRVLARSAFFGRLTEELTAATER